MLSREDIVESIRQLGTQQQAADTLGVSQQHVSEVLNGTRGIGPKILEALHLEEVVSYVPKP